MQHTALHTHMLQTLAVASSHKGLLQTVAASRQDNNQPVIFKIRLRAAFCAQSAAMLNISLIATGCWPSGAQQGS